MCVNECACERVICECVLFLSGSVCMCVCRCEQERRASKNGDHVDGGAAASAYQGSIYICATVSESCTYKYHSSSRHAPMQQGKLPR